MEYKYLPKWEDKSIYEKVLCVLSIILAIAILVYAIAYFFLDIKSMKFISDVIFISFMVVQGLQYIKYDRRYSIFYLCLGIIIFICSICEKIYG